MTTAVSPLKGKKPAANAEIPDAIDMFGCSMDAGTSDILAGSMIMGRLEFMAFFVLFIPSFWKQK